MAPLYRALFPMAPREIDALRPSQIASILGLDRVSAVQVVALTDDMLGQPVGRQGAPPPGARQRLRMVSNG